MKIELNGVSRSYRNGSNAAVNALNKVNLTIEQGSFICIMGVSGSGKTTLLNLIGAIDVPTEGRITYDGIDISRLSDAKRSSFRNENIGFLFQDYALIEYRSVEDNLKLPLYFSEHRPGEFDKIVTDRLRMLDMSDFRKRKVNTLSGGQKQKVALARALACNPSVILCDEPTGALDSASTKEIIEILLGLKDKGITVVVVSHDPIFTEYADRNLFIKDGVVGETGC